ESATGGGGSVIHAGPRVAAFIHAGDPLLAGRNRRGAADLGRDRCRYAAPFASAVRDPEEQSRRQGAERQALHRNADPVAAIAAIALAALRRYRRAGRRPDDCRVDGAW